jgi:general secretion pathway protein E
VYAALPNAPLRFGGERRYAGLSMHSPPGARPAAEGPQARPRFLRAVEFTTELVVGLLEGQGVLGEESRKDAIAREAVQRARLLRERAQIAGRALDNVEVSPIEIVASLRLPDARRPSETLDEDKTALAVARALGLGYRKIDRLKLDAKLITRTISRPFARKRGVLPLAREDGALVVAVSNPFDHALFEELRSLVRAEIVPILSAPSDIQRCIAEVYGFRMSIDAAHGQISAQTADIKNLEQFVNLSRLDALEASSEPVVAAAEFLLLYAFEQRASDIHIEPNREESVIRLRIDGVLHPVYRIPKAVHAALTNRFKVMARLDIASRKPLDGRLRTARGAGEMELRVSTVPTAFGDKIVIRVLDPSVLVRDIVELGFFPAEREELERWLRRPHGLVVVTGPTGSGKTTTLYSALQALASPEVNVVTVEDPIEMVHEGFNQIQADTHTGTSFAEALRHVLRQDPDVIMVGEIRDGETAAQAVQASLTGHLVLSTLHTNDTVGAIARLGHLGVPGYLVAATLVGVISQRLVRNVCPACGRDVVLTADEVAELDVVHPEEQAGKLLARRGAGCAKCRYTGYYGRSGIFEVLPVNARLRRLVSDGATPDALLRTARQDGLRPLRDHAIRKVAAGATTLEEALRATADAER